MSNILLCDMGGTHARFARYIKQGEYAGFKKYRLNDFSSFEDIVQTYINETQKTYHLFYFATALMPVGPIIGYNKFKGEHAYKINMDALQSHFNWNKIIHKMDSEAGGLGLRALDKDRIKEILSNTTPPINDRKILISIGTGALHALVTDDFVSTFTDGHSLPTTVTEDQRKIETFIRNRKDKNLSLIMEDFVSGRGLRAIAECISGQSNTHLSPDDFMQDLKNNPETIRLFFEFLGLYAHNIVSVTGFYGGIYLTGGVIDNLIKHDLANWDAFETYFRPPMLPVVNDRLNSTSVNYVLHNELPLLGLTTLP